MHPVGGRGLPCKCIQVLACRAALVEDYPYPVVTDWNNTNESKTKSIALQGEPISLEGRHFDKVESVCVNDVDVAMPPVLRVSVKLSGSIKVSEDAKARRRAEGDDGVQYEGHFEVHLLSRDAKDWFKNVTGEEYAPTKYLDTCKTKVTKLDEKRRRDSGSSKFQIIPYNASIANLTFEFVVLGVPSDEYRQIPAEPFRNQVRACQRKRLCIDARFIVVCCDRCRSSAAEKSTRRCSTSLSKTKMSPRV